MNTATTLNPVLIPDRDAPYRLDGVYELIADGCRDELVLAFDGATLTFHADPDTDSLEARYSDAVFQPSSNHRPLTGSAFDRFTKTELGWTWMAVNQQGYCDSVLLSFGGITPNVLIHVMGSSIKVIAIGSVAN